MIQVPILNQSGTEVGTYEFDPAELAPNINKQLLHDAVVMYEHNQRQGTVKTKARGEVAGSTKKLYRQKGTGRARVGPKRNPVRRGGGHTFAKRPHRQYYRLPKKAIRLATRMALLSKFQDGEAVVLEGVSLTQQKTKEVAAMLKALGLSGVSCLLAIEEHDSVVWRCSRNIEKLWVSPSEKLNAYDLLHQHRLVITTAALDKLRKSKAAGEEATEGGEA